MTAEHLQQGLILYLILAGSVALHEFGHAKAADMLGDPLPRSQGRVTLNPFAHMDPIGTVAIPLIMILLSPAISIIGWGKPVQISLPDPRTRVRDEILITLAGPGMNFVIALTTAIIAGVIMRFRIMNPPEWAEQIIGLNSLLIAFNFIPLPPLDGSRIMRHIVGMSEEMFRRLMMITPIVLLILINTSAFQGFLDRATVWVAHPFIACMYALAGRAF